MTPPTFLIGPGQQVSSKRIGIALRASDGPEPFSLCGRFITIADDELTLDAIGALGCFYRINDDGVWASSSPELLRRVEPALPYPEDRLVWRSVQDWFPPPHSGVKGISRLIPSQALNLRTGAIRPVEHIPPPEKLSYDQTLADAQSRLRRIVRAAAGEGPLWVPLTAGMDSRVVLAACYAESLDVVTFTFEPPPGPFGRADVVLAPQVARRAGYAHRLIRYREPDPARLRAFDEYTAFHSNDFDRAMLASWQEVPEDALVLGGNAFEAARCYYWRKPPPVPDEWREWIERTPSWLDPLDRLYIDQRLAGWLSANELGLDFIGRRRIHVANCGELLSLLIALPVDVRRDGIHQDDLVRELAPPLASLPVNPSVSMVERITRRISRERELVEDQGSLSLYARHRMRRVARRMRTRLSRS